MLLGLLASKTQRAEKGERVKEHLLLTRYSPKRVADGDMLSIADVQEMDIGIMPLPDEPWTRGKSGYKLVQYMACGIPVVADRPGVGANLHNHQVLMLTAHLKRTSLPPAGQRAHTTAIWRYSSGIAHCPPSDMSIPYVGQTGWHALGRRLSALTPIVLKPFSRARMLRGSSRAATG